LQIGNNSLAWILSKFVSKYIDIPYCDKMKQGIVQLTSRLFKGSLIYIAFSAIIFRVVIELLDLF
jgi:hypothetical protein